jgi:predicted transcriptional regulator
MKRMIGKQSLVPIELVQVKIEDPQAKMYAELEELFSAAASTDAIKIFNAAKGGIKNSSQAIKELDLTQKKYYTHLKRLIDAGLVERVDGAYRHTTLGKIGFKLTEAFMTAISQKERLDLVDRLSKAKNITVDETEEIMRAILKDTRIVPGDRITDLLGPVRMADTWEKVVEDVIEYIDKAEESVYFASQYFDVRVVEAIVKACERKVKMYLLTNEKENIMDRIHIVLRSLLISPKSFKSLFSLFSSSDINIKYGDFPYTFIIVDRKIAMVEVPQPYTKAFSLAFFFHNERLCQRLIESFNIIWEKGTNVKAVISQTVKGLN